MSGVYINGMEMPTRCCECRLSTCHSFKERPLCDVLVKYMSYGEWEAKRLDDCPLVPVPPHGRLKDYDQIIKEYDEWFRNTENREYENMFYMLQNELRGAPTIIPSTK